MCCVSTTNSLPWKRPVQCCHHVRMFQPCVGFCCWQKLQTGCCCHKYGICKLAMNHKQGPSIEFKTLQAVLWYLLHVLWLLPGRPGTGRSPCGLIALSCTCTASCIRLMIRKVHQAQQGYAAHGAHTGSGWPSTQILYRNGQHKQAVLRPRMNACAVLRPWQLPQLQPASPSVIPTTVLNAQGRSLNKHR